MFHVKHYFICFEMDKIIYQTASWHKAININPASNVSRETLKSIKSHNYNRNNKQLIIK